MNAPTDKANHLNTEYLEDYYQSKLVLNPIMMSINHLVMVSLVLSTFATNSYGGKFYSKIPFLSLLKKKFLSAHDR